MAQGAQCEQRIGQLHPIRRVGGNVPTESLQQCIDLGQRSPFSDRWFGSDLTEDPQVPNYTPLTGTSLLQPVGVEMVGTSMGRPGAQDVVADELYWAANGGRENAPFDDAATYDSRYRPAALPAAIAVEEAGTAANPNLIYLNWKAEYGHTMVHLRPDEAIIENWVSPQREPSSTALLVAQHRTPVGNPHLEPVLQPSSVIGSRDDPTVAPQTLAAAGPPSGPADAPPSRLGPRPTLPTTGGGAALGLAALAAAGLLWLRTRRTSR